MAGTSTVFMAPELIPAAVATFVVDANRRLSGEGEPWRRAAWIAHRFVEIHPFPDFNGRLARLLLALVLHVFGLPFAVALRSQKKSKGRYLQALRKADDGNLTPLTIMVARTVVESFERIDQTLRVAGIEPIVPAR